MYQVRPKLLLKRDFDKRFPDTSSCLSWLHTTKWPEGYVCSVCGGTNYAYYKKLKIYCNICKHKTSVKANTVFDKSRIDLHTLFYLLWRFSRYYGISALGIRRMKFIHSYKDAWRWIKKYRSLCSISQITLSGTVYLFDIIVGRRIFVNGEKHFKDDATVLLLAEINNNNITKIFIRHYRPPDPGFVNQLIISYVDKNAIIKASNTYNENKFIVKQRPHYFVDWKNKNSLPESLLNLTHRLKDWLGFKYQKFFPLKNLDSCLDEFSFKYNNKKLVEDGLLFYKLLEKAVG